MLKKSSFFEKMKQKISLAFSTKYKYIDVMFFKYCIAFIYIKYASFFLLLLYFMKQTNERTNERTNEKYFFNTKILFFLNQRTY
jgi:hypothetical protein